MIQAQRRPDTRPQAILFGTAPHGDQRTAPEVLRELSYLADTGALEVIGCMVQHRRAPDPHSYVGAGKLEEIKEVVAQTKAELIVCNDSLSPTQGKHIEKAVGCPVLDRSELILHIFEMHARTPQAKLQVELARLQYQLPRLKRLWTHLERQRGGIGVRGGAGEKQIDLDRSDLRTKISQVSRKLAQVEARKSREIQQRPDRFTVAIVGYTNAGKSTLMNRLTDAGVLAEDRLFSTLDTRTRPWRLRGGRIVLLSDTVGFIDNLPHQLVASFHATLEEALNADLLFVVCDASSPTCLAELATVEQVLTQLEAENIPRLVVLNKLDAVTDPADMAPLRLRYPDAVAISAKTGAGLSELEDRLQLHLASFEQQVQILVPHTAGHLLAELRANATVLSEFYTEEGCLLECVVNAVVLGRMLGRGALVHPAPDGD
ncbi:MAG: GTPase HflX [Planctomycetota bacterium]